MSQISALKQQAFDKKFYVVDESDSIKQIDKNDVLDLKADIKSTAEKLYKLASEAFKSKSSDFKILASISFDYTNRHFKLLKQTGENLESLIVEATEENYDQIHFKNLALFFRNKISAVQLQKLVNMTSLDPATLSKEERLKFHWAQIVLENRLHYQFHATDTILSEEYLSLPVKGKNINWSDVEIEEKESERVFKLKDKELFKTDKKGNFVDYHAHGISGILPGSPQKPQKRYMHAPFINKEASGEYKVWVCTALKNLNRPACLGDHSFVGLEDPKGRVTFYGQFGTQEEVSWYNSMKHFNVGIESPDRYQSLPLTNYINTQTTKTISKEDFQSLRSEFSKDFEKNNLKGSFLKDNCTGYTIKKLQKVGIDIDAKMSNTEWLGRQVLSVFPKSFADKAVDFYENLPSLVKKSLHFAVIPFYGIALFANLFFWATSYFSEEKASDCDVKLFDVFFRPWNIYSNHPLKLYKWQQNQKGSSDG